MDKCMTESVRSVIEPINGCRKCSKAEVCKYKDYALESYDAACSKIPAAIENIISLTFVCKYFTQIPQHPTR